MAPDELEGGALRFPLSKKTPPTHAPGLFPDGSFRFVIPKNDTRRFRDVLRGNGLVPRRPADLPGRALNQMPFVSAIPDFGARKNEREPAHRHPLRRSNWKSRRYFRV